MGLYEKIKLLAKEKNISIRKLEEDLGYGNGTIRRWETTSPGFDKVEKVADYFGVTTDYLSGRNPEKKNSDGIEEDEDLLEIAMMFRKNEEDIPEDKREQFRNEVEKYIRFVKSELEND